MEEGIKMLFDIEHEYYSIHPVNCFIGKFNLEGFMVHDTPETYHGYLKILGKKHYIYDCKVIDGRYNYKINAFGMTINVDAFVDEEDMSIGGTMYFPGNRTAEVKGGAVRRVRLSDGYSEEIGTWQNKK